MKWNQGSWLRLLVLFVVLGFCVSIGAAWRRNKSGTGIEEFGVTILREKWTRDRVLSQSKKFGEPFWDKAKNRAFISQPSTRGIFITVSGADALEVSFDREGRVATCKFEFQSLVPGLAF